MNKILISIEKDYLVFSKHNIKCDEENINNTNVINIKSLKFTENYIKTNLELVCTFINLIVLKFNINNVEIKNLDIAESALSLIKNIKNLKYINFTENKELTYTIVSLLLENKNLEKIECYSLPNIMFYRFDKNQVITRSKILSTSEFLKYNKINTYSDLFNKESIIIGRYITKNDVPALIFFLNNNKNIRRIELKKYDRKNLNAIIHFINKNNLQKVNIIINETSDTTNEVLEDIKKFDELSKKYNINIKIKYSKEYKQKNKLKELNIILLKNILISIIIISIVFLISYKLLEQKHNKGIENNIEKINDSIEQFQETEEVEQIIEEKKIEEEEEIEKLEVNNNYISSYYKKYDKIYKELIKLNSDTVGWLTVNNTKINYPVVQTVDNEYYLNHAYDKTKNIAGWIYMDYRNSSDNISQNTIIYGHSMLKGNIMFSSLQDVLKSEWYNNDKNLIINFSIKENDIKWQVFSIYTIEETNDYLYTNFSTEKAFLDFIEKIKSRSIVDYNIEINKDDKILTLSTCYKDDKHRVVVHAKKI